MRKLNIIPIIHSRPDLGSLEGPIQQLKNHVWSESVTRSSRGGVENFWSQLKLGIESWQVETDRIVLYQDGLPFTGQAEKTIEHQIVRDLAAQGSPNHQLLVWLMERGATLMGTESTELLLKEYDAIRKSLADGSMGLEDEEELEDGSNSSTASSRLLTERDQFIAKRVGETLQEDQVGVLFIGMLHRVEDFLDQSIAIEHPFGRPTRRSPPIDSLPNGSPSLNTLPEGSST